MTGRDEPRALTDAERQARRRARGRAVSVVLSDPDAIAALDALVEKHGGLKAAIEAMLRRSYGRSRS